jgi:hypothetical protein
VGDKGDKKAFVFYLKMRKVAAVFGLGRFGWPRLPAIGPKDSRGRLSYIIALILRFHMVSKSIIMKNDLGKFLV